MKLDDDLPLSERRYVIRLRSGEYFTKWRSTEWETVSKVAVWTKQVNAAHVFAISKLSETMTAIVCGFAGSRLERIK
jgi:hypothetical protein